jgi:hypothetical protein
MTNEMEIQAAVSRALAEAEAKKLAEKDAKAQELGAGAVIGAILVGALSPLIGVIVGFVLRGQGKLKKGNMYLGAAVVMFILTFFFLMVSGGGY